MGAYILKRLLLMIPTLFGIMLVTFAVIQFVPGGPIERIISQVQGTEVDVTARIGGGSGSETGRSGDVASQMGDQSAAVKYRGAQGLDPEFIKSLEKQFGFDKPAYERFFIMMKNYLTFNFGESYFRDKSVVDLMLEKMPVSISLGLWLTLITYLVSVPLGIRKAVKDGTSFDIWTSGVIIVGYAIPGFILAIMLVVLFAGGSYFTWFPLRGLTSENFDQLNWIEKILDYAWHLVLPLTALGLSSFATMTLLTKNSFLDEIRKQYVTTGTSERLERAARALRPCLSQCHAARHFRLSRRVPLRVLCRFAADRTDLHAGWSRLSHLHRSPAAGLSGGFRQPLYLHASRPRRGADQRPYLYVDRSANRLRVTGTLRDGLRQAQRAQPASVGAFQT